MKIEIFYNPERQRFIHLPEGEAKRFNPAFEKVSEYIHDFGDFKEPHDVEDSLMKPGANHTTYHHMLDQLQRMDKTRPADMSLYSAIWNKDIFPPYEPEVPPEPRPPGEEGTTNSSSRNDLMTWDFPLDSTKGTTAIIAVGTRLSSGYQNPSLWAAYTNCEEDYRAAVVSNALRMTSAHFGVKNIQPGASVRFFVRDSSQTGRAFGPVAAWEFYPVPGSMNTDGSYEATNRSYTTRSLSDPTGLGGVMLVSLFADNASDVPVPSVITNSKFSFPEDAPIAIVNRRLLLKEMMNIENFDGATPVWEQYTTTAGNQVEALKVVVDDQLKPTVNAKRPYNSPWAGLTGAMRIHGDPTKVTRWRVTTYVGISTREIIQDIVVNAGGTRDILFGILPGGATPAINTVTIVPLVPDVTAHFQFFDLVSDLAATFGHSNAPIQPQHTFQFQFKNRQSFIMKQTNTIPPANTPWEDRDWNL